jgi:hypothetical protein
MKKTNDSAAVHGARIAAKRMAREGEVTHQQALDQVARNEGHRNWSSFLAEQNANGSENRSDPTSRSRDSDHVTAIETRILEDAAQTRRSHHSRYWKIMPAIDTLMYVSVATSMTRWIWAGFAIALACAVVVYAAQSVRLPEDGAIPVRRRIRSYGHRIGWPMVLIGLALASWILITKGMDGLLSPKGGYDLRTIAAAFFGLGIAITSTCSGVHAALVRSAPETVRPRRTGDVSVPATPATLPTWVGKASKGIIGACAVVVGAGAIGLVKGLTDMALLKDTGLHLMGTSMVVMAAACLIAMIAAMGLEMAKPGRAMTIKDDHSRAARAKRFLSISEDRGTSGR